MSKKGCMNNNNNNNNNNNKDYNNQWLGKKTGGIGHQRKYC